MKPIVPAQPTKLSPAEIEVRPPGKEISALAWIEDAYGSVLFVKQVAGKQLWSLPGGKVQINESLEDGLCRETYEEIGLKVSSLHFVAMFDRPQKASLSFLYRVTVVPGKMKFPKNEIATAEYFNALPAESTPSARYFWHRMQVHLRTIVTEEAPGK